MSAIIKAWWFAAKRSLPHGDGRRIRVGRVHLHHSSLVICKSGLHASRKILDALRYATGSVLYRVECSGEIIEEGDKLVCTRRKYLAVMDAEEILHHFARLCALDVMHLWEPPDVVVKYLRTGDKSLRAAARAAAWDAAWDAARAAQNRRLHRMGLELIHKAVIS